MSIEVISPPRRPVTRSVSAKRAADEIDPEDGDALLVSVSPRPKKVRRVTMASGAIATDRCQLKLLTLRQNFRARFHCSRAPEAPSRPGRVVPPML